MRYGFLFPLFGKTESESSATCKSLVCTKNVIISRLQSIYFVIFCINKEYLYFNRLYFINVEQDFPSWQVLYCRAISWNSEPFKQTNNYFGGSFCLAIEC